MKSLVVKRSVDIDGRKTSVSLEDAFSSDLKEIAHMQRVTLSKVITEINKGREGNLSSAIRVFVFEQVRAHGNLWRYSRSRRSEEETAQMNASPVQPSGWTRFLKFAPQPRLEIRRRLLAHLVTGDTARAVLRKAQNEHCLIHLKTAKDVTSAAQNARVWPKANIDRTRGTQGSKSQNLGPK